jgi:hypothetical protein
LPNSPNLPNSLNTRQIRRSESQKFAQYSPNLPERVTKILPASGHCLGFDEFNDLKMLCFDAVLFPGYRKTFAGKGRRI